MQLLRIGNRLINPSRITDASFDAVTEDTILMVGGMDRPQKQCIVGFGNGSIQIFYDAEATAVWNEILLANEVTDITPVVTVIA